MTQTASISSINKKKFLKKAFKGFSGSNEKRSKDAGAPPFPVPEKETGHS
ncbi:hypothetical protein [Desulfovibrio sp. JC010]|nr:hypothetical protein [Desulfovibrio sp. JC010]